MALIVQKFGGSSVKDRDRIFNVARIVANTHNAGNDVVVVVSAQGDTTDDLIAKAGEITHNPSAREMDMLLASGEQISISLLAMALNELGCHAISLTGWQAGFRTDRAYTKARITRLETERISSELERNRVVVVAGFQGLNKMDDITTLGRGGSDTSAVAIAAALHADRCQIFTDVEGVYTADPRKVRNTRKLDEITFDEMLELASLGEKKVALFALIPDNDASFNFLVSLLYASTFQELFYSADRVHGGSLPVPVHFLMDEFANVSLPDDFDKLLATMRSRNISVSIIIQNIAQLKALFEKQWESIIGNCDEFLYLGGNETSTHKLISENYLGKSTLWLDTYGKSTGHSGSYSTNNQITGRELMTPDEVRMLDNNLALLFIRGEAPLMDEKYDLLKHPNVKYTTDGGAPVYSHGGTENAVADMAIGRLTPGDLAKIKEPETLCELLSDEDMEKIFQFKEEKQNETV